MNNFQTIEIIGVVIIIGLQLYIFYRTVLKIKIFKKIFNDGAKVITVNIPVSDLQKLTPNEVISNCKKGTYNKPESILATEPLPTSLYDEADDTSQQEFNFRSLPSVYEKENEESVQINLILAEHEAHPLFNRILSSLNTYLVKNRGAASDFHLIKDVVERNTDTLEEEITHTISIPLYLGLLGTMFGVVFGLFNISDLNLDSTGTAMGDGISILLGGVKIAMIASFVGLALTVFNSGLLYKRDRFFVEVSTNGF